MLNNQITDILLTDFTKGLDYLLDLDKKRLRAQGHYASGRLERSLRYEVYFNQGRLIADFYTLDYGIDLDRGVPASRVNYTDSEIKTWARIVQPGLSEQEINRFVFFVRRKHAREGIPTKSSNRFSSTGERLNWIKRGTEIGEREFSKLFSFSNYLLGLINDIDK